MIGLRPPAPPWLFAEADPGPCPGGGPEVLREIEASGLRGRGGARFPAGRKWRAVAERSDGGAVVLVNGAEGEPCSSKDRTLLATRPHLVLDGARIAAETVGASAVVLYVNRTFPEAVDALQRAIAVRAWPPHLAIQVVLGPARYVAGEETAAVQYVNGGEAKPAFVPPRPFERGVAARPTLVGNVETYAAAALVARFGSDWYRSAGTFDSPGTMLLTVGGAVERPGVYETPHGVTVAEAVERAGARLAHTPAILVGGYFGSWIDAEGARHLRIDDQAMASAGVRLGTGVLHVLPAATCGVAETARVLGFLAHESARQCGPCIHGLRDVSLAAEHMAHGRADRSVLEVLPVWADQLAAGRGACRHPEGAIGLLRSALTVFAEDFRHHLQGACAHARGSHSLPIPHLESGWR